MLMVNESNALGLLPKQTVCPSAGSGRTVVCRSFVTFPFMLSRELVERSKHKIDLGNIPDDLIMNDSMTIFLQINQFDLCHLTFIFLLLIVVSGLERFHRVGPPHGLQPL
jgi:hypothetical protein